MIMENILEYGFDWNLYENLECLQKGEQNLFKTASNIRHLLNHIDEISKHSRDMEFESTIEQEHQRALQEKEDYEPEWCEFCDGTDMNGNHSIGCPNGTMS